MAKAAVVEALKIEPTTPPEIKSGAAHVESAGYSYKTLVVTVGADFQFSWLNEYPAIWRNLQSDRNGKALAPNDRLEIRGPDFTIFAAVNDVDNTSGEVFLYHIQRVARPKRTKTLFRDSSFEVKPGPTGGYIYVRLADGVRMGTAVWPTPESAQSALMKEQYGARS
jgi:hypothetical protein